MSGFDRKKKSIKYSIKGGVIIDAKTIGILFTAANVKPPKASLDSMDITKLAGGICGGALVNDYAVNKKWINEWCNNNFTAPLRGNKNTQHQMQTGKHPSCFADPWGQAKGKDCLPLLWFHFL